MDIFRFRKVRGSCLKIKMKSRKVSKNALKRIITSPDFVDTIEKCIDVTEKTGYETEFAVAKKIFGRKILFSPTIEIGNNHSVGSNIGLKRARKDYKKITGKKVNIRNLNEYPDFVSYCTNQNQTSIPLENLDFNEFLKNKSEAEKFYLFIHFHTHPGKIACPSEDDLKHLTGEKRRNSLGGFNVSPIEIIAGVSKNNKYIPLLLFQENEEEIGKILDDDGNSMGHYSRFMNEEEFEKAKKEIEAYWYTNSSNEGFYLSLVFGRESKTNFYNQDLITYDRKNKQVLLYSDLIKGEIFKTNLSKFEFEEWRD